MDWLKDLLGEGDKPSTASAREAWEAGEKVAMEFSKRVSELGSAYHSKGQNMEATVFLCVAVLRAAGIIKQGICKTQSADSPIRKTWEMLEETLMAEDMEAAIGNLISREAKRGL